MTSPSNGTSKQQFIVSYMTLRRLIGILGILLPAMLLFYSLAIQQHGIEMSISLYYFTQTRNEFVIILSLLSLFLLCYEGYDNDRFFSRAAGFFGIVVALVHTNYKNSAFPCEMHDINLREIVHLGSAALFFLLLAYMSWFLFTKTTDENKAKGILPAKKKARNRVYKICAVIILLSMILIVLFFAVKSIHTQFCRCKPVFWLESVALLAFGFSWLVKGETLWKD